MTTETLTLADFLLARIAEDEEQANRSIADLKMNPNLRIPADWITGTAARVLAECEAKRRIIELRYSWNLQAERGPEPPLGPILQAQVITADTVLRTLAMVYADHPDYSDEWRP